jgi:hypothetical protein
MHAALAALRLLGGLGLGLLLGVSALQVTGMIRPDPLGLLVPIVIYAVIGIGTLVVASPWFGVCLLVGWAAPWLLVGWVVATDEFLPYLPFPAAVTALYVVGVCLTFYRKGPRRQGTGAG